MCAILVSRFCARGQDMDRLVLESPAPRLSEEVVATEVTTRYRRPGDVLRLLVSGTLLVATLIAAVSTPARLLGTSARVFAGAQPATDAGRLLVGLCQVLTVAAGLAVVAVVLGHRRFRLFATLVAGGGAAALVLSGLHRVAGQAQPHALAQHLSRGSWIAQATFP